MKRSLPKYPAEAKERGIQGTVVLNGVIDTAGHLTDVRVMAGPPMLQPAALDAVRQWIYQPYTVDGQPIEVEADISVVFALGR